MTHVKSCFQFLDIQPMVRHLEKRFSSLSRQMALSNFSNALFLDTADGPAKSCITMLACLKHVETI